MTETQEQELKRLRALADVQGELLEGFRKFESSMPFSMGDIIRGYSKMCQKVDYLSEVGSDPDEFQPE